MREIEPLVREMIQYKNADTECSWPVLLKKDGEYKLALFTYAVTPTFPNRVIRYDLAIWFNETEIVIEDIMMDYYQSKELVLTIDRRIPHKKLLQMFQEYCKEMYQLIEHNYQYDIKKLNKLFRAVIPPDVYELYEIICPEFMDMINVHSKTQNI